MKRKSRHQGYGSRETASQARPVRRLARVHKPIPGDPPYSGLARDYDRLVGKTQFAPIRAGFEYCLRNRGLHFRSAADVGCGTGVFLGYLSRYRVPLCGVDASPQMLRVARGRLAGSGIRLILQDMRRLCLPQRTDLITCTGDTLNYLWRPGELGQTLRRFRENLNDGGHLFADLLAGVPPPDGRTVPPLRVSVPGSLSFWRHRTNPQRGLTQVVVDVGRKRGRDWHWIRETHRQRWFSQAELRMRLAHAGLRMRAQWYLERGNNSLGTSVWLQFLAQKDSL